LRRERGPVRAGGPEVVHVVAAARVQETAERGRAGRRLAVVYHVQEPELRGGREGVARWRPERRDVEGAAAEALEVILEDADVLPARRGGAHQFVVAARSRDELAQESKELTAVAVPDQQDAIVGAERASAVKREDAGEADGLLDPRRVMVLARPGEVDGLDAS